MNYEQQAIDFAKKYNVKMSAKFIDHNKYFFNDDFTRDIYRITLSRNGQRMSFKFGQSVVNEGIEPTLYEILSCLTKYDPYTFYDFCLEFGYDEDSRAAHKMYLEVKKEWYNVKRLFDDCLDELREIN